MLYKELDTPALIVDNKILNKNLMFMQEYANRQGVALRPHTKTTKSPYIALLQEEKGAKGITVAKVGEAEVMASQGLKDIFIANEIVGKQKFERIKELSKIADVSFGLDSVAQLKQIEECFTKEVKAKVLIEIEVGENRSGIIEESSFIELINELKKAKHTDFLGIFSHDGHSYNAKDIDECLEIFNISQERTLSFARLAKENGLECKIVSIGSTPSLLQNFKIFEGITEIRPGTYIYMDSSMGATINTLDNCAATILTTVISKPTATRVITDVGAKGITAQTRKIGISKTAGMGTLKDFRDVNIDDVFDEHAIIYNENFRNSVEVGDKVEIIPVHICPVCNLYDKFYLVEDGEIIREVPILCKGKLT